MLGKLEAQETEGVRSSLNTCRLETQQESRGRIKAIYQLQGRKAQGIPLLQRRIDLSKTFN